MSTERPSSFDFNSVIPQAYRSRAEAFARCLHDKLISLGGVAGLTGSMRESDARCEERFAEEEDGGGGCASGEEPRVLPRIAVNELDDMEDYDVPYRVLRESSSTSDLEKHFSSNLHSTKRYSKSGDSLSERLSAEAVGEGEAAAAASAPAGDVPAIRVTTMDELETDPQVKLRRCSSLKTWKTPPGTPGEKKIVRFADALGLDLADVRTFLDEIPKIPSSAYVDLNCSDGEYPPPLPPPPANPTLIPRFLQPGTQMDFAERVRDECVCLESATLTDTAVLTVSGCVRVRNVSYEKSVHVRYTKDNWTSFSDLQATYIPNSCDGFSDRFSFVLYGHTLRIGERLEFAVRLDCPGRQYWDNNGGRNYVFECLPQSPSTSQYTDVPLCPSDAWSGFY